MTPIWAATLSISTSRGWKGLLHTTSAPNLPWGDRSYEGKIHDYYGVGPYWDM